MMAARAIRTLSDAVEADLLLLAASPVFETPPVGPGDRRFLKLFRPIARGRFVMIGSGDVLYQLTFIDDLVDGLIRLMESDEEVTGPINLGNPGEFSIRQLAERVVALVGASGFVAQDARHKFFRLGVPSATASATNITS